MSLRIKRVSPIAALTCAWLSASCVLVSSFDKYDPDAPEISGGGDGGVILADGEGPFTIRVDVPAIVDARVPAKLVVHVTRSSPTPLRVEVTLPETVVTPAKALDIDAATSDVTFEIDAANAPHGPNSGKVRVSKPTGDSVQEADIAYQVVAGGAIDPTFGKNGILTIPLGNSLTRARSLGLDQDAVVVGGKGYDGTSYTWTMARVEGTALDPTFGTAGIVEEKLGDESQALALFVAHGALWAGGSVVTYAAGSNRYQVTINRYGASGGLLTTTALARMGDSTPPSALIAPAVDGAWVAAWDNSHSVLPDNFYREIIVAKLDTMGSVVGTHRVNPIAVPNGSFFGLPFFGIDDSPGDLRVVGKRLLQVLPLRAGIVQARPPFMPARVIAYATEGVGAGALDPTFGEGGIADTKIGGPDELQAALSVTARADDSLVVVGGISTMERHFTFDDYRMMVKSFSKDGTPQPAIANPLASCSGTLFRAVTDAKGRAVVVGHHGTNATNQEVHSLAIVRLHPDGTIDRSFGSGRAPGNDCVAKPGVSGLFGGMTQMNARQIAIDSAGRIVVAGYGTIGSTYVWFAARFLP